mgnify:CR=1 FL=1
MSYRDRLLANERRNYRRYRSALALGVYADARFNIACKLRGLDPDEAREAGPLLSLSLADAALADEAASPPAGEP